MFSFAAKGAKPLGGKGPRTYGQAVMMICFALLVQQAVAGEEQPSAAGVAMSATLLGTISFVMCLYYFINYDDEDIKKMTWETISSTISIFCAVLLWSSFNDLAEAYVIEPMFGPGETTNGALLVDITHMLVWFAIMQVCLACFSGAAGPWAEDSDAFELLGETEQEEVKESKEVNMACFAVLCAHITGFASINAFGTIQSAFFSSSPWMALLTPVLALVVMLGLQRITDNIRQYVALGDDGTEYEFEKLWDEECEEAENDVMGLALSFTTVSALRFLVNGCLPNQEGKEEECPAGIPEEFLYHHTMTQKMLMMLLGISFALIIFVMRSNWPEWLEPEEIRKMPKSERHAMALMSRLVEGIYVSVSMCFSWSFFFGLQMILAGFAFFDGEPQLLSVVLALVLSAVCMGAILPLDKLADADWTDEHVDTAIRSIMSAMGLLIGFGWEQCFDAAVDALARESAGGAIKVINQHTTKLALTVFCAGLLVPAWKWYMLPFIVGKGWEAEYPLRVATSVAKKMASGETKHEDANEEVTVKKMKQLDELGETIKSMGVQQRRKSGLYNTAGLAEQYPGLAGIVNKKLEDGTLLQIGESTTPYQALAPNESIDSLKDQVKSLTKELEQAKSTNLREHKRLDDAMNSMVSSMKHMNDTAARIVGR